MSDDDSFVILGTSPTPSMQSNLPSPGQEQLSSNFINNETCKNSQQDTNDSSKSKENSLTASQLKFSLIANVDNNLSLKNSNLQNDSLEEMENNKSNSLRKTNGLWDITNSTKSDIISQNTFNDLSLNTDKPCVDAIVHKSSKQSMKSATIGAVDGSLAASFLLGDVQLDVLKANVHSQFPSLCSSSAATEDIVRLQTFMSEYVELKDTLKKNNMAMRQHFSLIQKWQNEVKLYKEDQIEQKKQFEEVIAKLRNENMDLKKELESKMDHFKIFELSMKKESNDLVKELSDKTSQIQVMNQQIQKLEEQHLVSFEYIKKQSLENQADNTEIEYVPILEHQRIVKNFERQLSALTAKNLEFEDMRLTYIDEINCLKVNLTSADELLRETRADIVALKNSDKLKTTTFENYEKERNEMRQEIQLLKTQVEVYSKDFQLERDARQTIAGERDTILSDLRLLQQRNLSLIEEATARYEKEKIEKEQNGVGSSTKLSGTFKRHQETGAVPKSTTPPPSKEEQEQEQERSKYICPLCNEQLNTLNSLQTHVNACLDSD